jgi:hypothetical protein
MPREHSAIAKLAVWGGLDLPLGEGLDLERRLARRMALLTRRDDIKRHNSGGNAVK